MSSSLQKILLSGITMVSFTFYAIIGNSKDLSATAAPVATTDTAQPSDTSAQSNADFQAYVDQINAAAQQQKIAKPSSAQSPTGVEVGSASEVKRTSVTSAQKSAPQQTTSNPSPAPPPVPTPAPAPVVQPTVIARQKSQYNDGTYTGPSVDVFYGYVQIEAVIQSGRLESVKFIQYPNDRSTSRYINSQAMPILQQQAISAQSANVDGVSGASATSQGFIESLGRALTQAHV